MIGLTCGTSTVHLIPTLNTSHISFTSLSSPTTPPSTTRGADRPVRTRKRRQNKKKAPHMKKERINKRKIQHAIICRPDLLPILDDDDEGDVAEEFHRSLERTIRGLPRKDYWSNMASCLVVRITPVRSGLHERLNLFKSDSWLSSPGNSLEKLLDRSSP
ncbi:hypothetical protein QJS10_CPB12g00500 [Acorus calamus]|uniref:Uncharacterized protein n=1 Tax=Acorus calamus TaxID=4465 RepID=A0AAV9DNF7_ACOCL|nr:hypothetical protein QJS10_CPB12g00500 [Acorus calamus]